MADRPDRATPDDDERSLALMLALGAVFGTVVGLLTFVITGSVLWFGLGPGVGVSLALLYHVVSEKG